MSRYTGRTSDASDEEREERDAFLRRELEHVAGHVDLSDHDHASDLMFESRRPARRRWIRLRWPPSCDGGHARNRDFSASDGPPRCHDPHEPGLVR